MKTPPKKKRVVKATLEQRVKELEKQVALILLDKLQDAINKA